MKKIQYYIFTALFLLATIGCEDYLKEESYTDVGYDYLETRVGMEAAVVGVYQAMRWYTGAFNQAGNSTIGGNMEAYYCLTEYGTDFAWEGADGGNKDAFNKYLASLDPNQLVINRFWNNNYKAITRANTALMYLPKVPDMTDAVKAQREAELKFLRAYYYFDLVQHFGPVPVITDGNVKDVITDFTRSPVADVYKQIISDLRAAAAILPDVFQQTDRGRATKWAATHLLAKVYLTRSSADVATRGGKTTDLDSAAFFATQVIGSGRFSLESNFANVFEQNNQKTSREIIWDVQGTKDALFSGAGASGSDGGNQLHLYWVTLYDTSAGMIRDIANGRPWRRLRPNPNILNGLWDKTNDSRLYKTFNWVYFSNNAATAATNRWPARFFYINPVTQAQVTTDVIYTTPAHLVGTPKFRTGDTAIYFSSKYYGALSLISSRSPTQTLLNAANYRQMLIDIAKAPYRLIPVDINNTNMFPTMLKWLDNQRPDINHQAGSRNFHRMRLAETHLIAAEAFGRKGDWTNALLHINIVRSRAAYASGEVKPPQVYTIDGGINNTLPTTANMVVTAADVVKPTFPSGAGFNLFVDWMLEERARELYGELNRWEDLVRTGTLVARAALYNPDASPNVKDFHKLRPIPNTYTDRVLPKQEPAVIQNPGYY